MLLKISDGDRPCQANSPKMGRFGCRNANRSQIQLAEIMLAELGGSWYAAVHQGEMIPSEPNRSRFDDQGRPFSRSSSRPRMVACRATKVTRAGGVDFARAIWRGRDSQRDHLLRDRRDWPSGWPTGSRYGGPDVAASAYQASGRHGALPWVRRRLPSSAATAIFANA